MMKRNIWIVVILLALLPTILIGSIANSYMFKTMEKLQEDSLLDITRIVGQNIESNFDQILSRTYRDAKQVAFLQTLKLSSSDPNSEAYGQWSKQARSLLYHEDIHIIGGSVIDLYGNVIVSTDTRLENLKMDKAKLYQEIVGGDAYYMNPITDERDSHKMEIAVPIMDNKSKLIGILRHVISLNSMEVYIKDIEVGETGFVYLIRKDGPMIYHKSKLNNEMIYNEFVNTDKIAKLADDLEKDKMQQTSGVFESQYNGIDVVGAYQAIPSAECIVVSTITRDEIYRDVEQVKSVVFAASFLIGILSVVFGYLFGRHLTGTLVNLNSIMKRIANGDLTLRCPIDGKKNEYNALCESINLIADNLQKSETELRMTTRIDGLTRLPNRYTIYEVLDTLLYKNKNQAILIFDLDEFQKFNENLGYDVGDRILCEVSDLLRTLPQQICYPSRIMGDEFLIFINDWDKNSHPEKIAEKIVNGINNIHFVDDIRINISASIGIEILTEEKLDKIKLIKRCYLALNKAKEMGKNTYVVFSRVNNKDSW